MNIYLLRGLARETRHWGNFIEVLGRTCTHGIVHPLEIPGAGRLNSITAPLRVQDYVHMIRQSYLNICCPSENNMLIGLSFGGMIGSLWTSLFPDDFQSMVVINSSSRPSSPVKRFLPSSATALLLSLLDTNPLRKEQYIAGRICNLADHNRIARRWAEIRLSAPMTPTNQVRQLIAAATFAAPQTITVPTLLLCSRQDRLVSSQCSKELAARWGCEIRFHDQAGHDLTTDDPMWCASQINQWLN